MGILGQVVSRSKVRIVLTDTSFFDSYDIAEPFPSAMVESFRAFGYYMGTAIDDLIDNSITAGASRVWLTFCWDGSNSWSDRFVFNTSMIFMFESIGNSVLSRRRNHHKMLEGS